MAKEVLNHAFNMIIECDSFIELSVNIFGLTCSLFMAAVALFVLISVVFYTIKACYHILLMVRDMLSGWYKPCDHTFFKLWK